MQRHEAKTQAVVWAERAQHSAKNYPHIPSSEHVHIDTATRMAQMWVALYGILEDEDS